MAARSSVLGWVGSLCLVIGTVVALAGWLGRGFEAEYGGTIEGEMIVPNVTIAVGVLLFVVGIVVLVSRSRSRSGIGTGYNRP